MAERQPSKLHVASSNLVSRSTDPAAADGPAALRAAALRLRAAIDRTIHPSPDLTTSAEALSDAYRNGLPASGSGAFVHDRRTAEAYAAARMPATFAAVGRALLETARSLPGVAPRSLVDLGAGPGTAGWAAATLWPSLEQVTLIDREPEMVELGRRLAATAGPAPLRAADWRIAEIGSADVPVADVPAADLVVAAYVLAELDVASAAHFVDRAWAAARGAVVIVEPGSRAGFTRILTARDRLIAAGATIVAPCPANVPCPVREPEWCHFLARLDRSPLQRSSKGASRSWEDEPYSFLVAARPDARGHGTARRRATTPGHVTAPGHVATPGHVAKPAARVVLGRPRHRPGRVELRICGPDGLTEPTISRRAGSAWRAARDLAWGDRVEDELAEHLGLLAESSPTSET